MKKAVFISATIVFSLLLMNCKKEEKMVDFKVLTDNYFKGIHGFKEYKQKLVTTDGINQLLDVFTEIEQVYADYVFEG